jgi:hypothetical protein
MNKSQKNTNTKLEEFDSSNDVKERITNFKLLEKINIDSPRF